jgi:hypothetical protein
MSSVSGFVEVVCGPLVVDWPEDVDPVWPPDDVPEVELDPLPNPPLAPNPPVP